MNPEFSDVGNAFVQHYYQLFQGDRSQMLVLYQDDSLMSFEGAQAQGLQAIGERLEVGHPAHKQRLCQVLTPRLSQRLSFQSVQFQFTEIDCQPRADGGIVVFVLGQIQVGCDGHQHPFAASCGTVVLSRRTMIPSKASLRCLC